MEELIFVLPTLIIFFVIIFQIIALLKKGFDFIKKNYDLTIEQAGEKIKKNTGQMDNSFDQDEVKTRIAEAEQESLAESKERILKENKKNDSKRQVSKERRRKKIEKDKSKRNKYKQKNGSLGQIFAQYNEVERAVIYHEILSKPKALKRD
ncbi:MAG: hypothetical protein ACOCQZ_00205 [Halanaerobium sp.]